MKCKNCGTDLVGMEHACPMCGAPLPTMPPQAPRMVSPQEVQSAMPQSYQQNYQMNPVLIPLEEVQQTVNVEPEPEQPEQSKSDNKMFAIILGVVALAAIIVGIFLGVLGPDEDDEPKTISNKLMYAGYEFTLPLNYTGGVNDKLGLTIKDSYDNRYTVLIDFTNKYEAYKTTLSQTYPTQINDMIVKMANNREFISIKVGDVSTNSVGTQYITTSQDFAVSFVGFIVKGDYSAPGSEEFEVLNTILNTAEKKKDININSQENAGREGIKLPVFDLADFTF